MVITDKSYNITVCDNLDSKIENKSKEKREIKIKLNSP